VCTLRTELVDWLRVVQSVVSSRSEPEQRRVFDQNAARVYRLQ
jgi:predicted TIM-barrel fold metal-dependent hydrolase